MEQGPPGHRDYVAAHLDMLRRTAYLMCGDWHLADDVVSTALVRLLRHWPRVTAMEQPGAYVRKVLVRAVLDERRRPWRHRERDLPASLDVAEFSVDPADRLAVIAELAALPPRRRAVLVLRYFCGLSVEETAAALGCSAGTVKSQSARALATLRTHLIEATA
jgi:RNA polymerase sigma-70 factor (sigma-E family)